MIKHPSQHRDRNAPRARAVDRTHLLFLKQGLSAQLTSKRTLEGDVIPSAQFAAATLQTIFWTRTARCCAASAKRAARCSWGQLAAADMAPTPQAQWWVPCWVRDNRGAGLTGAAAAQRRGQPRSGLLSALVARNRVSANMEINNQYGNGRGWVGNKVF